LAQCLGVPFEFAEEPLGPLLETGVGRFSGCGERFTDPRHGSNDGMLGMPNSVSVMRSCIAARTPPN